MGADGSHLVFQPLQPHSRGETVRWSARMILPHGGYYPSLLYFLRLGNRHPGL
jgi:hypothetical protein